MISLHGPIRNGEVELKIASQQKKNTNVNFRSEQGDENRLEHQAEQRHSNSFRIREAIFVYVAQHM